MSKVKGRNLTKESPLKKETPFLDLNFLFRNRCSTKHCC